jgi:Lar family restriction alleviation protein
MTERSEDALKACPFCGGDDENLTFYEATDLRPDYKGHVWGRTISCTQCGISMSDEYEDELIAAWNTRSEASAPVIDEGVVDIRRTFDDLLDYAIMHTELVEHEDEARQSPLVTEAKKAIAALEAGCAGLVAENARLRSALERLDRNFDLLLAGKPVRDVAETKAETRTALRGDREQGEG